MKILYFDLNMPYLLKDACYPVGGATVQWYSWIKGFAANSCRVGVLTWTGAKAYVGYNDLVEIIECFDFDRYEGKIDWISKIIPALSSAIKRYGPDIVVQGVAGTVTGALAFVCKMLEIPFIYRVANDMEADSRIKERLGLLQRTSFFFGLKCSNRIICQNSYQSQRLKKKFSPQKVAKIPNPFDISSVGSTPIMPHKRRRYIAWIGIFQHQKNLPALLQVVKELPQFEFRIAGQTSASLDIETKQALTALERLSNVKFVGYLKRSEIQEFLSHAYLLLNTSLYEGFSNTFLESLFAGTPVITRKVVDPDNIISSNGLGRTVENYSEMSNSIKSLIKMKDREYHLIARRCREYIVLNHDPQKLARCFLDVLSWDAT